MIWNILTFALFLAGFPLLICGADSLVKGASRLAVAWGVSALAVGLTVVAYGTSMPELAVTVLAVWKEAPGESADDASDNVGSDTTTSGAADIAIGNVVGSNIANILLVLGASATVAPLVVSRQIVKRSLPLMVFVSVLVLALAWDYNGDGRAMITRWQGLLLVIGVALYTWRALAAGRAEKKLEKLEAEEIEDDFGHMGQGRWAWSTEVGRIVLGLICLVAGGRFLVEGAVAVAHWLNVSELMISLTIVAIGTSLPEVATCIVAVMRGQRDLAVGNAVGSNIFNVLLVLGSCALVAPGGAIEVNQTALTRDIPIMIAVALLTLPIFYTQLAIARWEGCAFVGLYIAYTIYLVLRSTGGETTFSWVMVCVAGMIFAVTIAQSALQIIAHRRPRTRIDTRID